MTIFIHLFGGGDNVLSVIFLLFAYDACQFLLF